MGIRVKAKEMGYYKGRRRPNAEFTVDSEKDIGRWMEVLGEADTEEEAKAIAEEEAKIKTKTNPDTKNKSRADNASGSDLV